MSNGIKNTQIEKNLVLIYKINKYIADLIDNEDHPVIDRVKELSKLIEKTQKKKKQKKQKKFDNPRLKNRVKSEELKEKAKYEFDGNIDITKSKSAKY
jgi:hypothetical protein